MVSDSDEDKMRHVQVPNEQQGKANEPIEKRPQIHVSDASANEHKTGDNEVMLPSCVSDVSLSFLIVSFLCSGS